MNVEKITSSLGINLDDSISKIDKIMEQKEGVEHDNMEDMIIEFTNDLSETLSPKELALILAIKTVENVIQDQVKDFVNMIAKAVVKQSKPNNENPLGSKLGF